jgi:uncharacterized protein (DUF4415 family)
MSPKMIRIAADDLPPLSAEDLRRLAEIEAMPDSDIDLSETPELTPDQLARMRPAEHWRPLKRQITARVDSDVLAWLKQDGKGYQSRLNAILRQAMLADRAKG